MAAAAPPIDSTPVDTGSTPKGSNRFAQARQIANVAHDPGAAAKDFIVDKAAGQVPGLGAAIKAKEFLQNASLKNAVAAGGAVAESALAGATAGASTIVIAAAKNKWIRYLAIGLVIFIVGGIVSSIYNAATANPVDFYLKNHDLIDQMRSNDLSTINVGVCQSSGAGSSANDSGQTIANQTHVKDDPIFEDCLKAKAAAATIQKA